MRWWPRLYREPIPPEDVRTLGLDQMWKWLGLFLEWGRFGMLIAAKPVGPAYSRHIPTIEPEDYDHG